jgi:DsbC/DsbD-like thiol-disulfide interchange protein
MRSWSWRFTFSCLLVCGLLSPMIGPPLRAAESPWLDSFKARTRLVAGVVPSDERPRVLAFIEIEMPEGWKTYWRNPGDAGGIPPAFDWSASSNLASATVLYPAPLRMTDRTGNTIGYKHRAIFPVEFKATDPRQPVKLAVTAQFGICKDLCVPVDAALVLDVAPGLADPASHAASAALARVPRKADRRRPNDPLLVRTRTDLSGASPQLVLETRFPSGGTGADVFLEAPDGVYVPLPKMTGDSGRGSLTFTADLGEGSDYAALKGKKLRATLVDAAGASSAEFTLE